MRATIAALLCLAVVTAAQRIPDHDVTIYVKEGSSKTLDKYQLVGAVDTPIFVPEAEASSYQPKWYMYLNGYVNWYSIQTEIVKTTYQLDHDRHNGFLTYQDYYSIAGQDRWMPQDNGDIVYYGDSHEDWSVAACPNDDGELQLSVFSVGQVGSGCEVVELQWKTLDV